MPVVEAKKYILEFQYLAVYANFVLMSEYHWLNLVGGHLQIQLQINFSLKGIYE